MICLNSFNVTLCRARGACDLTMKKYLNPSSYWRAGMKVVNEKILEKYDIYSAPKYSQQLVYPPVFIIGAPRSGSTLLFQALTDAFDVGYLTNRHSMYFGSPRLCETLFRPLKHKVPSNFKSSHGQTDGWDAPSECGAWWYRFFPRDPAYVTAQNLNAQDMQRFRRSLAGFIEAAQRPVIFKNLYASLRLEAIAMHIPEALFVWVVRDEVANTHSILEAKYKALGSYEPWWSVPLPDMSNVASLNPVGKVLAQVRGINNLIQETITKGIIPSTSVLTVNYEEFCKSTDETLNDFEAFFARHGSELNSRFSIPAHFKASDGVRLPQSMYAELITAAQEKIS